MCAAGVQHGNVQRAAGGQLQSETIRRNVRVCVFVRVPQFFVLALLTQLHLSFQFWYSDETRYRLFVLQVQILFRHEGYRCVFLCD